MSLVRLHNVSKSYDNNAVLRGVHFRLGAGDRVGLIGRNGAGKTTLLRLILGREEPDGGAVEIDEGVRVGYFSQFSELSGEETIVQVLDGLFAAVHAVECELGEIEAAIGASPAEAEMARLLDRQAELFEEMERCGGWTYQNRIDTVLTVLGFSDAYRERPIDQLSGGWRNRAALARILLEEPDVLLMEQVYEGNYAQYVREKPLRLKTLERQFVYEEELLAYEAEAIADRREAARNPSRALERRLASIKRSAAPRPVDKVITALYGGLHVRQDLCRVEGASKAYGGQVLFHDLTVELHRGERVVVVGPNGCGKTTLLRVLVGDDELDAGRVAWCKGAEFVYYNQVFDDLDPNDSVTHAVNVVGLAYLAPRRQVNRFLSLLRFSEMDLQQRIGTLSGGERARVALAQCLLSGASVVILDEPTNHLDVASTQVMERALVHFPGAVVVASHDRFFIDKVATRLLVFEGGGWVDDVAGNWTTWQAIRGKKG